VELGAQDKELVLHVARQGLKKLDGLFRESLILNLSNPCGKNSFATPLFTWSPNKLANLLRVIIVSQKTQFWHFKNRKMHIWWEETENGFHGVPRCPKNHVRVRYGIIQIFILFNFYIFRFDFKSLHFLIFNDFLKF
jgi:hypothetical protein